MKNPLGTPYFEFLVERVNPDCWEVCEVLHDIEWRSTVPRDRNREEDAIFWRQMYLDRSGGVTSRIWETATPSVLEVLAALVDRMEIVDPSERSFELRFDEILDNAGLFRYTEDNLTDDDVSEILSIVNKILDRQFDYSGLGGWFPLREAPCDQRSEELWYQMMAYLEG